MIRAITALIIFLFLQPQAFSQTPEPALEIIHLTGDFYIYKTYNLYKGARIPANGLYLVTTEGVVIVDSPWDTTQFQPLLDSIEARHHQKAVLCLATHFHEDRTAGLEYYRQQGIKTYTTRLTDKYSRESGFKRAEFLIDKDTTFTVGQYSFETYYPGHGHAPDNIVLWFANERILYGGCLIKSTEDTTLGYLGDADVNAYATTIKNVLKKCKKPAFVIPGHNGWHSTGSLNHTLKMARQLEKEN